MSNAYHAELLARQWHHGQMRKDGKTPYITHPEAVAAAVEGDWEKAVAWMHDLLEDTKMPITELQDFPMEIIEAVLLLTKGKQPDYYEYINIISLRHLTRVVKIADIRHNLSCEPSPKAIRKYEVALRILGAR